MSVPSTVDARASVEVDRVRSRERAVRRVFNGVAVAAVGWLGVVTVPAAEALFQVGQSIQQVWSLGARALFWVGLLVMATGGTHMLRFGGWRGRLAFTSFAAAGAIGLVAVAEQFETWFLDTRLLSSFDELALFSAFVIVAMGLLLLRGDSAPDDEDGDGEV